MKKVFVLVLILTMVFGTIAASALPPGQAKKVMTQAEWMNLMQVREAQEDDDMEGLYGPMGLLPPGLMNKGTPPGLLNNGKVGLPPGLVGRDLLPPGIQMRFREEAQWRQEWGIVNPEFIFEVDSYTALIDRLSDTDYMEADMVIRLLDDIELQDSLLIQGDRKVEIHGQGNSMTLEEENFDPDDWMMIVEDKTHLFLRNVKLDGTLDDEDDEDDETDDETLEGLVYVEEGAALSTLHNSLSNAVRAFGYDWDQGDDAQQEAEDLATYLINTNASFRDIDYYVTLYEGDSIWFQLLVVED